MKQTVLFRVLIVALLSWIAYSQMQVVRLIHKGRFPVSLAEPIAVTGEVDVSNSPLEIEGEVQIVR